MIWQADLLNITSKVAFVVSTINVLDANKIKFAVFKSILILEHYYHVLITYTYFLLFDVIHIYLQYIILLRLYSSYHIKALQNIYEICNLCLCGSHGEMFPPISSVSCYRLTHKHRLLLIIVTYSFMGPMGIQVFSYIGPPVCIFDG